jgi:nitroreductase
LLLLALNQYLELMDFFTAIATRASAVRLIEPAPTREHLMRIIQAGTRAPDHGRLSPWRFVVIEGDKRGVLGDAIAEAARIANPNLNTEQLQRERDKAFRAPTIIVVTGKINRAHKIPESDQVLALGAAAENMFLAAHALGYGVMWKTGTPTIAPNVKAVLGIASEDPIVAYLYVGTTAAAGPVKEGPPIEQLVRWL